MRFFHHNAFGLDISDLSIKIAALEKTRKGLELVSFGSTAVRPGIVENGEIKKSKVLANLIGKAIKKVKGKPIKTEKVICSLPEEKSFLDIIQLPVMKEEEIKTAVGYEIENYIPLPINDVYFDCQTVKPFFDHPKYTEVLVAAAPKKIIDSYLETLKIAGLWPRAFEIECQSIVRSLIKKGRSKKPVLIIDFGETRTTFIIFSGNSLRFTDTIPVSSKKLTEAIAKNLKVTLRKAEGLKVRKGLEKRGKVFDALIPAVTDLVEQIKGHLEYYRSHEKKKQLDHDGKSLNKILLCGGGANLKGLAGFLGSELAMRVVVVHPWKKASILPPAKSLSYATAIGLALRSFDHEYD